MKRKRKQKRMIPEVPVKSDLEAICDKLWKHLVRDEWGYVCAMCNTRTDLECHHLISRRHESTRYVVKNGILLCKNHHQLDPAVAPHENKAGFMLWLIDHHPERHEWMHDHAITPRFVGTKNWLYYCDVIRNFRQYFDDDSEYEKIVGIKFTAWLFQEG